MTSVGPDPSADPRHEPGHTAEELQEVWRGMGKARGVHETRETWGANTRWARVCEHRNLIEREHERIHKPAKDLSHSARPRATCGRMRAEWGNVAVDIRQPMLAFQAVWFDNACILTGISCGLSAARRRQR